MPAPNSSVEHFPNGCVCVLKMKSFWLIPQYTQVFSLDYYIKHGHLHFLYPTLIGGTQRHSAAKWAEYPHGDMWGSKQTSEWKMTSEDEKEELITVIVGQQRSNDNIYASVLHSLPDDGFVWEGCWPIDHKWSYLPPPVRKVVAYDKVELGQK